MLVLATVVQGSTTIGLNINTGGTLAVTGAMTASSTVQITGAVTTYGNVTLGDAVADSVTANGYFTQLRIGTGSTFGNIGTVGADELGVEGDVEIDGIAWFDGVLQASSTVLLGGATTFYGNLTVNQSATTTVSFSSAGINFDSNTFVIDPNANRVGVASSSPYVALGVVGTTTSSAGALIGAGGSAITQLLFGTCSVDLPAIAASSTAVATCTATGVTTADKVFVTPASAPNQIIFTSASSTAADTIQVAAYNTGATEGSINPAAATWSWMAVR